MAAVVPAVVCYFALQIVSWYVSSFIVKPNELVREKPYIVYNTDLTRQAYGLNRVTQREFPAETTPEAADPEHNQATLQNIRLWDWRALQDTLRQIQEIRTYYDFPGHRHRSLPNRRHYSRGNAGHPRTECREASGKQP